MGVFLLGGDDLAGRTAAYWKKRFLDIEAASNAYGHSAFRQIEPSFVIAERQIQAEIERWYGRYARNNQITMTEARRQLSTKELKEFRWDVEEYIKHGRENALDASWMKQLENASARVHLNRLEALKIRMQQMAEVAFGNELDVMDKMARKVFTEDYYHSIFEVQKGFNLGWEIGQIDEKKLTTLIAKPWAADGKNFSARIWDQRSSLVNELHTQLTRTCILGKAPDDAIRAISKKFHTTKNQAGRLVMTEQAYFHSEAQKQAFNDLDVEEFEVVATLDSHTSEICRDMDGKHFPMRDYQPGVTAPPFHVWCRSVTVPYFDDNFTGERAARDANGNTYYVPDDMTYNDWKKSMVDGDINGNELTNVSLNDTMVSGAVSGARNPFGEKAKEHAKKYYGLVRSMKTDVSKIANATGMSVNDIQMVKNFIFLEKHDLGGKELEYFEPDYMMAESWQRLIEGKFEKHDITMLNHEILEKKLMEEGLSQEDAHLKASQEYNYSKEAGEYYAKIKKYRKE